MKKTTLLLLICFIQISITAPALAGERTDKLKNGAKDFVTAPLVIGEDIARYRNITENKLYSGLIGMLEGSFHMVGQMGSGLFDIMTFPWPNDDC